MIPIYLSIDQSIGILNLSISPFAGLSVHSINRFDDVSVVEVIDLNFGFKWEYLHFLDLSIQRYYISNIIEIINFRKRDASWDRGPTVFSIDYILFARCSDQLMIYSYFFHL